MLSPRRAPQAPQALEFETGRKTVKTRVFFKANGNSHVKFGIRILILCMLTLSCVLHVCVDVYFFVKVATKFVKTVKTCDLWTVLSRLIS